MSVWTVKETVMGKSSNALVVCLLQSIIYDQLAEESLIGTTVASHSDCRFIDEINMGEFEFEFEFEFEMDDICLRMTLNSVNISQYPVSQTDQVL